MLILLAFAFISGLVTILAPCIWPLLPIVLSASIAGGKRRPLGVTLGVASSFGLFTLSVSYLVMLFHFDPNILRLLAVIVIAFLGITLLIPSLWARLEAFSGRISNRFSNTGNQNPHRSGFFGGYVTGFFLGIIWSPCAGPILATIAALSATLAVSSQLILVTLFYSAGLAIPLFIFSLSSQAIFTKTHFLNQYLGRIQQIFGLIMILTALALYTNYDKVLQAKILDAIPAYSQFLTSIEDNSAVQKQLKALKTTQNTMADKAPEFTGITHWLNTDHPLTIAQFRGKIVLVDFWTYTCINCIRTLPHVVAWDKKYRDKGLVIIGVHTPEFEFEKSTPNVESAIRLFGIEYPVAQDNDYATWNVYANHYWPAKYLIDRDGRIQYTHFGEGEYDTTEKKIQELLEINMPTSQLTDQTPTIQLSPETYIGSNRMVYYYPSRNLVPGTQNLTLANNIPVGFFSLGGTWTIGDEYSASGQNAVLQLNFVASKVFLVMRPSTTGPGQVKIILDGQELKTMTVDADKLYQLVDLPSAGNHLLRLEFLTPGTQVYAFTFG